MKLRLISFPVLALLAFSSCKDQLNGPPATTAASDTIAHWLFDGNTNDVSGNGRNATITGTFNYVPARYGLPGKAIRMIGNSQMNVQNMPNLTDSDSYTFSTWVSFSAGGSLISQGYGFGADTGRFWGNLAGCGEITSKGVLGGTVPGVLNVDEWHLITLAVSALSSATLYIYTVAMSTKPYGNYMGTNDSMTLQIVFNATSNTDTVLMDDALFLHYCLSAGQVTNRFYEGGWYGNPLPQTGWTQGNFGTTQAIEGICFTNFYYSNGNTSPMAGYGFACGTSGTLLRSMDSGKTWQSMTSGTTQDLYRISAISTDNAQLQQNTINGIAGGNNGTILRSTNGWCNGGLH